MIRATVEDASLVNSWLERDFPVGADLTEFLANEMNVCLCEGEGAAVFVWRGPGIYEVHCFFEQRGRDVVEISRAILNAMVEDYGARLIWAAVPEESRKVKIYVRWLGFKSAGRAIFPHGPCEIFTWESGSCPL